MGKPSLKTIVDELIALEPSLKEHRKELEQSIRSIIDAKPDTKFTNAFKQKLLKDLQAVIAANPKSVSLTPFQTMQKLWYALGGAAVASIGLYVTVINPMVPMPFDEDDMDGYMPPAMQREMMGNKMMNQPMPVAMNMGEDGNYVEHSEDAMGMPAEEYDEMMKSRPQSGGGGDQVMGVAGGGYGGGGMMMDSMMIAPGEPYPYNVLQYSYDGEVALPENGKIEVYRRDPLQGSTKADLLTNTFVADMLNVSKLKSLSVTSVSLSEGGDEPLIVNVDFNDGNVGIFRQLDYNKRPESKCRDQACYERYRLKANDMISDDRAIEIADKFAKDLGIDLTQYGEPVIQDDWRMRYDAASSEMKANFYFPEQVTVSYPYQINGTPIYDEWGNANGLTISVDVRLRTAVNMWGLRTMDYEMETMDAVDDEASIHEFIKAGSSWGYMDPNANVLLGKLGDPRMVYISQYNWNEEDMIGYEVYVPALYFPVTEMPEESYEYRKAVVVPLSKKMVDERLINMPPEGVPLPMPVEPFMEGAAG